MAGKEEYYILKCPFCDEDITQVMECPDAFVTCPSCERDLNLYTVFGYNMWLAEQGKIKRVDTRPIKDVNIDRQQDEDKYSYMEFTYDGDDYDFDEESIAEEYLKSSNLMQKRPQAVHEILAFNADICTMQYRYLTKMGFTRIEAIEIIKKLIEQDFIL